MTGSWHGLSVWLVALAGVSAGLALWAAAAYGVFDRPLSPEENSAQPSNAPALQPDRPAQIALLGTSLTSRGDWPDTLAETLSRCRPAGVVVRRIARPGAASDWGLATIADALTPSEGPPADVLIIEFALNDAALHRGVSLARSRTLSLQMLNLAGATPVFLAVMNPAYGPRGWLRPGLAAYYGLYRRLAREEGVGLIDTEAAWRSLAPAERSRLIPDGLHPSPEGMKLVTVPAFADALRPLICGPASDQPDG